MLAASWLVAKKDLTIEFRTRTAFISAVIFSITGLAIFYFAWSPTSVGAMDLAPGVIWVVFAFSSVLAVQRSFGIELPERAGDGLLVSPIEREAIYLGKAAANVIFIYAVQVIAIPAAALFYNLPFAQSVGVLLVIAALATVGVV